MESFLKVKSAQNIKTYFKKIGVNFTDGLRRLKKLGLKLKILKF